MSTDEAPSNVYARLFIKSLESGQGPTGAATQIANDYLDGKPRRQGKRKISQAERDAAFWANEHLATLSASTWHSEPLALAMARYFRQESTSNRALLEHIASIAPETVRRGIRYSGMVLAKPSSRHSDVDYLAAQNAEEFGDIARVVAVFETAHRDRVAVVDELKGALAALTPLELLAYLSLYVFEHVVPVSPDSDESPPDSYTHTEAVWYAIDDLLVWKLSATDLRAFRLSERDIAQSLAVHLSPFLFPSLDGAPPREDVYANIAALLNAQMELNSFIDHSADAFCYDDSIAFVLSGEHLKIVERDSVSSKAWTRDGEKLSRLHRYWLHRAVDEFVRSDVATAVIGRPENHEANRVAYIKAMRTQLQLDEVYGVGDAVRSESGLQVDVFQALLTLELMSAFYQTDFLQPYRDLLDQGHSPRIALSQIAVDGLRQPVPQIRLPLTWSDRSTKVRNITVWTVSDAFPQGNPKMAEAILDFWSCDLTSRTKGLKANAPGLQPTLIERPLLKMGRYLFQLPWIQGSQNNALAAINNLRRIGSRRTEAQHETERIEQRLAVLFRSRGFQVQSNYEPQPGPGDDPGEVDLICACDGQVLVLEIKSTFLRRSLKEAWLHGTNTLRKAGLQLSRKVPAVLRALENDEHLVSALGIEGRPLPQTVHAWIVDTSIEHDYQRFSGFLKVSLEEVLIALRDDIDLLSDAFTTSKGIGIEPAESALTEMDRPATLYPGGFSFSGFIDVVESEAIWQDSLPDGP